MSAPLVSQLTYSYRPVTGGADAYADDLHRLLGELGLRRLVFQRPVRGAQGEDIRFIPNPFARLPFAFWTQALFVPCRYSELGRSQVIVCHYPPYLLSLLGLRAWRRRPVLVGLSHGVFWDDRPRALRSRAKRALARAAFRRADAYVANDTHFLREMGLDVAPATRLFAQVAPGRWFIPCCVDTGYWQPGGGAPELEALNAVLVPRNLYHNRGVHLAVQAFARFLPQHPETNLVIVGARSQPRYAAYVDHLVSELRLADHVHFWGPVPRERMRALYAGARLCIIPSLCGEGTSLAALESMACGTATVTTDVAGLADLPALQAPATVSGLAAAMDQGYLQRAELGPRQRAQVEQSYSLPRWRRGWEEVLAYCGVTST